LDRYKVVPIDHKSLSKPVLFLVPSPTVNFCESMEAVDLWRLYFLKTAGRAGRSFVSAFANKSCY
jgi:hypothetical protein